jgi:hypothetical protein
MIRGMGAVVLAFLLPVCTSAATDLPRQLGKHLELGISEKKFSEVYGVTPSRCASCYQGEKMAEVNINDPHTSLPTVEQLGLELGASTAQVTAFFERGALQSLRLGGLKSKLGFQPIQSRYGKGRTVDKKERLLAKEWTDKNTLFRVTDWEGEFEIILADRSKQRSPR